MKNDMDLFVDFIEAPLRVQLALDVFAPPALILIAWLFSDLKSWFFGRPVLRMSFNECKFALCLTYVLMFGLTIYGRFSR